MLEKLALSSLVLPVTVFAQVQQPVPYDWGSCGPWHMSGGWGWGFGWIFPMFFFFLMVGLCIFMISRMWGGHSHHHHVSSALQILSERFARGDISKEEFEEKRKALGG